MTFQVILPCPPNRANDTSGWRGRAYGKQKYARICAPALMELKSLIKEHYFLPLSSYVLWSAHFQVAKLYDADNLAALCKWPIDLLVDAGILQDDRPDKCWPKKWPTQEIRAKRGYVRQLSLSLEVVDEGDEDHCM